MNVFLVYAHAEPKSFNGALFRTAQHTLQAAGHTVQVSDLYGMNFDPVSDRRNFKTVKNPDFFKQQIEEMHAAEVGGFAPELCVLSDSLGVDRTTLGAGVDLDFGDGHGTDLHGIRTRLRWFLAHFGYALSGCNRGGGSADRACWSCKGMIFAWLAAKASS